MEFLLTATSPSSSYSQQTPSPVAAQFNEATSPAPWPAPSPTQGLWAPAPHYYSEELSESKMLYEANNTQSMNDSTNSEHASISRPPLRCQFRLAASSSHIHHDHSPSSLKHTPRLGRTRSRRTRSMTSLPPASGTLTAGSSPTQPGKQQPNKKPPPLACLFCRGRKIACGPPMSESKERTC